MAEFFVDKNNEKMFITLLIFLCNPSFSEFEIQSAPISSNYRDSTLCIMFQTHSIMDTHKNKESIALSNVGFGNLDP